MTVYSGKDRRLETPSITNTDASASVLTARIENEGHALCLQLNSSYLMIYILKQQTTVGLLDQICNNV